MSIYVGDSNDIARTAKKLYVGGNGGIARSVIRAYAGDENNIARMVFGSPLKRYIIQDGAIASDAYWIRQQTPRYNSSMTAITPSGAFGEGYYNMYFTGNRTGNLMITDGSRNNLDFTGYQNIYLDYCVDNAHATITLCLQTTGSAFINASDYLLDGLNSTTRTTVAFDISNATGVLYFYLNMRTASTSSSTRHTYIYNLWLE